MKLARILLLLLPGLLFASLHQREIQEDFKPSSSSPSNQLLAQAPIADKVPTAGVILGWELNMNRNYSRPLDRPIYHQHRSLDDDQVIFFENTKQEPLSEDQFLLNTPRPPR